MVKILLIICACLLPVTAANAVVVGKGCTTAYLIDKDCDGYGVGEGVLGADADDNDATVNTTATVEAKYGNITTADTATVVANLKNFLSVARGYSAIGDIWFVSPTGDNATGTKNDPTKPFRYLGYTVGVKGQSGFGAGDVVLYRGGDYNTNLGGNSKDQIDVTYSTPVGTSTAPLIFAAFPGELPKFTAGLEGINGSNTILRDLWYVFDGFQIGSTTADTAGNGIVLTGAREVIWRNIAVYRKGAAGMRIMSYVNWPTATVQVPLKNITFEDSIVRGGGTLGIATHNIYWGHSIPKGMNNPATGCTVRNIISHSNTVSYDGMQFNGHFTNWLVEGSQFHSASSWGFSTINGPSNGTFKNNLVYNNNSAGLKIGKYVGFVGSSGLYAPNGESVCSDNLWVNNTIWVGNTFNGNGPNDGRTPADWNALHFYTETPCKAAPLEYTDSTTGTHYNIGDTVCPDLTRSHSGNIFRNNIMISYGSSPIRSDQRSHIESNIFTNNILYRTDGSNLVANLKLDAETWTLAQLQSDPTMTATGNINADPRFIDVAFGYAASPNLYNFRLNTDSPAVGAGIFTPTATSDIADNPRTNPPSIGAYTSGAATTLDTIPPATTASPAAGTYTAAQTVTLTRNESGTTYYTTDGTTPTVSSPVYTGAITVSTPTTIKFFSRDTAGNSETVKSAIYTITAPATPATPPTRGKLEASRFDGTFR